MSFMVDKMKTSFLHEFVVLAETQNFLAASDELFMSQSTLSRHIKELEEQLGVLLFTRSTRSCSLTPYGASLLPYAKKITALEAQYLNNLNLMKDRDKNTLVIGTACQINHPIEEIVSSFQKLHPQIRIEYLFDETVNLISMLKEGKCDFTFIREIAPYQNEELSRIAISEEPLYAYLPSDNPLSGKKEISINDLRDETFYLGEEDSLTYQMAIRLAKDAGLKLNIVVISEKKQQLSLVNRGHGVTLLFRPPSLTNFRNLSVIPITPTVNVQINCAYIHKGKISMSFVDHVKSLKLIT